MGFSDRLGWMLLGCVIGLFAGYCIRYLQEMKEELDEVDGIVKNNLGKRPEDRTSEDGFVVPELVKSIALAIVVLLTAWAAFASASASSKVQDTQDAQKHDTECTQEYLVKTVKALNERTEYSVAATKANVDLQKAQADFFALLLRKPPESVAVRTDAAQTYLRTLTEFVKVSGQSATKAELFPYPTDRELATCYNSNN